MIQTDSSVQAGTGQHPSAAHDSSFRMHCKHCDSLIPAGRESEFCCAGCEVVFRTISELGLQEYYRLRREGGALPRKPVTEVHKNFSFFNEPSFIERYTRPSAQNGSAREVTFFLDGIHCAACVWILEKLPELNSGVLSARVEFGRGVLQVTFLPAATSLGAVATLLHSLGYSPAPIVDGSEVKARTRANRVALMRIGVAGLCTMNVMMMALSIYQGQISGIEIPYQRLFSWVSLFLTVPVVGFSAVPFYRTSVGGLRGGVLHIDLPIVLAIIAAFALSAVNTVTGSGVVYYDSVCALVLLLLSGRWLQHRSIERVLDASTLLYALAPRSARLARTGEERFVESLLPQTPIAVAMGELVPVDGIVSAGSGRLNTAILTGESVAAPISVGSRVFAGSRLESGAVEVAVEAAGRESRLGKLMQSLERSAHQRAPLELFLDRVSKGFVGAVLIFSAATFWWWSEVAGVTQGIHCAVALLVVSCPCVLAVATPLTFSLALARAAKQGILIKNAESIERLTQIRTLLLDKTGTVTSAQMEVTVVAHHDSGSSWRVISEGSVPPRTDDAAHSLIAIARALEAKSFHPIAEAIRRYSGGTADTGQQQVLFDRVRSIPGIGVEGVRGAETWTLQSARNIPRAELERPDLCRIREQGAIRGASEAFLCRNGTPELLFLCADSIRPESAAIVKALRERIRGTVSILSGDTPHIVRKIAEEIGVPTSRAHGALTPEDKQRLTAASELQSATCFVGDGANDAAALTSCSVGVAVHGGAEVSLAVADVYLSAPGLQPLLALFEGSSSTLRVVKLSLVVSTIYNILGGLAAIGGYIGPLEAAILMPISSLSTISVALLSKTFRR